MQIEFFADVFILNNFFLNILSLSISSVIMKRNISYSRLMVSAALGSFWSFFLFLFPFFSVFFELLITIGIVCSLIVMAAFQTRNLRFVLKANFALLVASTLVCGCLSFAKQFFFLLDWECLLVTGILCLAGRRFLKENWKEKEMGTFRYPVQLFYQGKKKQFLAMADSGNRLRVPQTGKAVSVITYEECKGFCDSVNSGFYIPYRAVGTEHGMLFAVIFDKMEIVKEEKILVIEKPVVAISKGKLSVNGDFNMLLPEELVMECSYKGGGHNDDHKTICTKSI